MTSRLITQINTLARNIAALDAEFAAELGISTVDLCVLDQICQQDGKNASEFARSLGLAVTSFTPFLDRLQAAGFICRQPHPKDRRAVQIFLTQEGKAIKPRVIEHMNFMEAEVKKVLMARIDKPMPSNFLTTFFAPYPTDY